MSHAQSAAIDLASLLDDSPAPVYVLDEERRIVFCNPACARWVGLAAGQLLGQRCTYHSGDEDDSQNAAAVGLCPPPKVFAGLPQTAVVSCRTHDGRTLYRRGRFLPLSDGADESAAVVAVLEPGDCLSDAIASEGTAEAELHEQLRRFRRRLAGRFRADGLLGNSPAIQRARAQIELAAASSAAVVITGPAGAGKDHVARAIHYQRKGTGTLVPLSCAVLDTNLLRSTLRAAWSKSHAVHEAGSTLLLDDVDAMPPEAQSDLVELMASEPSRVRVISTSACRLSEAVSQGQFSPRLACLLSTVAIELPPLAERLEDLPLLAHAMLEEHNGQGGKQVGGFSPEALDQLAAYSWPGNLDELAAIVRQAHERCSGGQVTERDLPDAIRWAAHAATHPSRPDETIDLEAFLARVEKELLTRALRRAKGNKSKAAKLLGLTRPRLYRRLVALGLEQPDGTEEQ